MRTLLKTMNQGFKVTLAGLTLMACADSHDHDHDHDHEHTAAEDLCAHLQEGVLEPLIVPAATPDAAPELDASHVRYEIDLNEGGWVRLLVAEASELHLGFSSTPEVALYRSAESAALATLHQEQLTCMPGVQLSYEVEVGSYLLKFEPASQVVGFTWLLEEDELHHAHD